MQNTGGKVLVYRFNETRKINRKKKKTATERVCIIAETMRNYSFSGSKVWSLLEVVDRLGHIFSYLREVRQGELKAWFQHCNEVPTG